MAIMRPMKKATLDISQPNDAWILHREEIETVHDGGCVCEALGISFEPYAGIVDKNVNQLATLENLIGKPHEIEAWQINISEGADLYARIVQIGSNQAAMYCRNRILQCTFH